MNIFLSVPFSSRIDESGLIEKSYRHSMEALIAGLRERGHEVYCALEYAQWKMGGMTAPEEELKHDFEEINKSDKLIVLLDKVVSAGVQLENGYAFAKGKAVVMYQIDSPAWSNIAFSRLNGHEIVLVKSDADFVGQVLKTI
jgi:nucleoside 2-deoxyribosyltransferase